MKCPRCENTLETVMAGDLAVQVCTHGCAGMWFEHNELAKLDESGEHEGDILLQYQSKPGLVIDLKKRINCPKCLTIVMMCHYSSVKHLVMINECPGCAGYWLDTGELKQLRDEFSTNADREAAAAQYFDQAFNPQLNAELAHSKDTLEHSRKVRRMFELFLPLHPDE